MDKKSFYIKCDSEKIIPGLKILDYSYLYTDNLELKFEKDPEAFINKEAVSGNASEKLCSTYGYLELSVDNYRKFTRHIFRQNKKTIALKYKAEN